MSKQQAELAALSVRLSLAANKALEQQSLHDGLTELANRRFFDTDLASQMGVARCHPQRDNAGAHHVRSGFFQSLQRPLRPRRRRRMSEEGRRGPALMLPPPRRHGGALWRRGICPHPSRHGLERRRSPCRACKTRRGAAANSARSSAASHFVSLSGGIAVFDPRASTTAGQLIAAADKALFQAKSLGRNRIGSDGDDRNSPSPADAADPQTL